MLTRILAIRHAKPLHASLEGVDTDPPLSDEGRAMQTEMATRLQNDGVSVDLVLHSPALRAQQSAEILHQALGGELQVCAALGSAFDEDLVISSIFVGHTTLLVGHDPTLAHLVNLCLGRQFYPSGMPKSGGVLLEFPTNIAFGKAKLVATYAPEE